MTIATFWLSTALSELFAPQATAVIVKSTIPWGFTLLIPTLALAGGSRVSLAKGEANGVGRTKLKRMPWIAANGILVVGPSALYLASKAGAGEFDSGFYTVQAPELVPGATNVALLGLNMQDGLSMKGRFRRRSS